MADTKTKSIKWRWVILCFFALVGFLVVLWWPKEGEFWSWPWLRHAEVLYTKFGALQSIVFCLCFNVFSWPVILMWKQANPTARAIAGMIVVLLSTVLIFSMIACNALDWH